MKILIENSSSLNSFLCSLPFVKGLTDLFPQAEINYRTNVQYKEFQEYAFYIHKFVGIDEIMNTNFDIRIDLENWKVKGSRLLEENISKISTSANVHLIDKYLAILPVSFRKRNFVIKESLEGFEKIKELRNAHYDLVVYPIGHGDSLWNLKEYDLFIRYFLQMNPTKKVLIIGLEPHKDTLEQYFGSKDYIHKSVELKFFTLSSMISFLKRISIVVTPSGPIKYLLTNPETTVIELKDCKTVDSIYKDGSYTVHFEKKLINKFVYTEDEIPFDGNEHFLAYLLTSIMDEDYEKLNWLCESYKEQCQVSKIVISKKTGLRKRPMEWTRDKIIKYMIESMENIMFHDIKDAQEIEYVYYDLHDDTELSQDQIMYEVSILHKEVKKLKHFFENENAFSHHLKLRNYDVKKTEGMIIESLLSLCSNASNPEGYFYTYLTRIESFLGDILNISGQKLLENISMTSDFYS